MGTEWFAGITLPFSAWSIGGGGLTIAPAEYGNVTPKYQPVPKNKVPKERGRPIGAVASVYSKEDIAQVFDLTKVLYSNVQSSLRKKYNKKRLSKDQKKLAENISEAIIVGSKNNDWSNIAEQVVSNPNVLDKLGILKEVQDLASEHDLNIYAAALLYHSSNK